MVAPSQLPTNTAAALPAAKASTGGSLPEAAGRDIKPVAAATTGVKGLEAIIPVAPNTSYYHYYRSNGLVRHPGGWLGEDIDSLFDSINSGDPARRETSIKLYRDGEMAKAALSKGTGIASPEFLLGTRLVRAYNEVGFAVMRDEAHRAGEKIGIPLAGDDAEAVKTAVRLVRDAGHEPVVVGGLARAREFDYGSAVFGKPMTAAELRSALGLKP